MRALFALLALSLAVVLVWQWRDWPPPPPGAAQADAAPPDGKASGQTEENPLDLLTPLGEKDEYAEVTERPLFLPDRRPPTEEPPEKEPAPEPEQASDLARMDLNAVLITPAESSAWVRDPSKQELVRLRLGDDLAGWSVKEILADRLLVERQGETDTLILRDYKNMPPPTPPPRRRPAARNRPQQPQQQAAKGSPRVQDAKNPNQRRPAVNRSDPRQNALQRPGVQNPRTRANTSPPRQ